MTRLGLLLLGSAVLAVTSCRPAATQTVEPTWVAPNSLRWSADGSLLAFLAAQGERGGAGRRALVVVTRDGEVRYGPVLAGRQNEGLTWLAGTHTIVFDEGSGVRWVNLDSGEEREIHFPEARPVSLAPDPDGELVAVSRWPSVRLGETTYRGEVLLLNVSTGVVSPLLKEEALAERKTFIGTVPPAWTTEGLLVSALVPSREPKRGGGSFFWLLPSGETSIHLPTVPTVAMPAARWVTALQLSPDGTLLWLQVRGGEEAAQRLYAWALGEGPAEPAEGVSFPEGQAPGSGVWSLGPDGKHLAWTSLEAHALHVAVLSPPSTRETYRLTTGTLVGRPAWLPDGSGLAVCEQCAQADRLLAVDLPAERPQPLVDLRRLSIPPGATTQGPPEAF